MNLKKELQYKVVSGINLNKRHPGELSIVLKEKTEKTEQTKNEQNAAALKNRRFLWIVIIIVIIAALYASEHFRRQTYRTEGRCRGGAD